MDRAWLDDIAKLPRINPREILTRFGPLPTGVDLKAMGLRNREQRRKLEIIEACLFCYGLSCRMGRPVWVIDHEGGGEFGGANLHGADHSAIDEAVLERLRRSPGDYDFVAVLENDGDNYFARTQLKEVTPHRVNPAASVQPVIDGLLKYSGNDLTVAIHVNQTTMLDLDQITIPPSLRIAALWFYGAMSPGGSRWFLSGNLIEPQPNLGWFFDYPTSNVAP